MNKLFFPLELKCHFNLREPKSLKPTCIYLVVTIEGRQWKFASGVKIYPNQWDFDTQESLPGATAIDKSNNRIVSEHLAEMKAIFEDFKKRLCYLSLEECVSWLRSSLNGKQDLPPLQWLKANILADKDIVNNPSLPNCTARQFVHDVEKLERFCQEKGIDLKQFSMIDTQFVNQYRQWLEKQTKADGKHLSRKYVNSLLTNLHSFLKRAVDNGKMPYSCFNRVIITKFKNKDYGNGDSAVFLRDDEIIRIANVKCDSIVDEAVRDVFVVQCLTGQRISDMVNVWQLSENRCSIPVIEIVQQKTKAHVTFAIPFAMARDIIINKYNCNLPNVSRNTVNRRIKQIARMAGINDNILIKKHLCGDNEPRILMKHKWEGITSHTGRRSFVSNLAIRGWNYELIAKYTGHSCIRMVERYDCSTLADIAIFKNNAKHAPNLVLPLLFSARDDS